MGKKAEIVVAEVERPGDGRRGSRRSRAKTRRGWKYFSVLMLRLAVFSAAMAASFAVTVRTLPSLQYSLMTKLLRFEVEKDFNVAWVKWGLGFYEVSASPKFLFHYLEERESSASYLRENQLILRTVLAAGVDPNVKNSAGRFPLEITIDRGLDPYTEILVSSGANPCERFADGTTVLHHIAERSFLSLESLLSKIEVQCPKEINAITPSGESPLSLAVATNNKRAVKELIAVGARIDMSGAASPPLHSAVTKGRPQVAKLLIKEGASLNEKDEQGSTPLLGALQLGKTKQAKNLLQSPDIDVGIANKRGQTPLMIALQKKQDALVDTLLSFETDYTVRDAEGRSIIHYVVEFGKIEVLEKVILSIERKQPRYFEKNRRVLLEPLFFTILKGDLDRFRLCIALGASRYDLNAEGHSPLMKAVELGQESIVGDLLEHTRATINFRDFQGRSAIFFAKSKSMLELLLKAGANPLQRMFGDKTLMQYYVEVGAPAELIQALHKKYPAMSRWKDVSGASAAVQAKKSKKKSLMELF